ncbi:hypothetical protein CAUPRSCDRAFT_5911, partial [Caulochytrium protostelioides]
MAISKTEVIDQVKREMALANFQRINSKCFKLCVTRPGTTFTSAEKECVNQCTDRFQDAWNLISQTYMARLKRD